MEIQEEIAADMKHIRADLSDIKEVWLAMLQDLDVMEQRTREQYVPFKRVVRGCLASLSVSSTIRAGLSISRQCPRQHRD
jgi:hypothetical protein